MFQNKSKGNDKKIDQNQLQKGVRLDYPSIIKDNPDFEKYYKVCEGNLYEQLHFISISYILTGNVLLSSLIDAEDMP